MDPFSLAVGIVGLITAFKEVYLLSKTIYEACQSARASDEERRKLQHDFRFELVFVQSFGRFYLQGKALATYGDNELPCTDLLGAIFEELRKCVNDYKKLAEESDAQYIRFSPYLNDSTYNTKAIEFDLDEPIPPISASKSRSTWLTKGFRQEKEKAREVTKSARWALFQKQKFQAIILTYREENQKLKDLLPLILWAQLSNVENKVQVLGTVIQDDDASTLGLRPHAQIRQLNESRLDDDKSDHCLQDTKIIKLLDVSPASDLRIATVQATKKRVPPETVIVELKPYPPPEEDSEDAFEPYRTTSPDPDIEANVRRLASLLSLSSGQTQDLRTLPFKGYIDQPKEKRYSFLYHFPLYAKKTQPISLHSIIEAGKNSDTRFSLATRFHVAQMIARSIGVFHADSWVHKSICSQSIVFFDHKSTGERMVESPYLADFEYSRPEEGRTFELYSNCASSMTLYLHPDRPGAFFTKVHDLYALGVVLLEIATWRTVQDIYNDAVEALGSNIDNVSREDVREHFIKVAKVSIPHYMGVAYLEAVVTCLDDTFEGQTSGRDFPSIFQSTVVQKLSAKHLL